jgi:hypothetical protein
MAGFRPQLGRFAGRSARSVEGHEDQFRLPSLYGRCRLGEATFAGMGGKEEDAPFTAIAGGFRTDYRLSSNGARLP